MATTRKHQQTIRTPDWVKHAVFYQVFPDRFARSERNELPRGLRLQEWGATPTQTGFQGGDLYGVVDRLDHLAGLGVNALYLCPIFASASNHRYHTYDYFQVDPLLGGNDALRELIDRAHDRDIKVVLDGVFNHTGRGFWPFHHILENGGDSPYLDWFHIHGWPLHPYPGPRQKPNYSAWWSMAALPKLNTDCPAVREYIYEVAKHWIDFGADGWRLDVPGEIDDDSFWQEFRRVVKGANPEAYICGEIWHESQRWLQGDQFDGVMNYVFTGPAISFFAAKTFRSDFVHPHLPLAELDARQFSRKVDYMHGLYDWEINFAQMNMLDSHDMARLAWLTQEHSAQRLCVLFQMTMPGAPCIYYGDEVGLAGGPDPGCREAFPWHKPDAWDRELLRHYQQATALRHAHPALRTGSFQTLHAEGDVYAFRRALGDDDLMVLFNTAFEPQELSIRVAGVADGEFRQVWPSGPSRNHAVRDGLWSPDVPARAGVVVVRA
ncbi:Neopullulanase [Pirellulimonas nuda]|uniref:Neopullulanase n=1 Tax=Pirellulimonas nuda TaxID=2528009 RepID=A0A518DJ47_9BACT|nr:glycoside hydrolase family 13 protein [Pirellulimonas nuda]QDU91476.1 Neopullulanase [Pirellulimonas nuda]